ncbi:unnamed protein product [Camellia sinensis]
MIETLSDKFSIGSFFTVLTKLSNLKVLSLVSLGLWGQLPTTINRIKSLEKLNISSNFISGEIPGLISVLTNLTSLVLADNIFNGSVPDMKSLQSLQEIDLSINRLGPEFPSLERHVPQTMTMLSMGLPPYHVFTLEEMEDATNNFDPSNLAGEGSQGQLYRGWLRDSSICLLKCLKLKQKHSQQSLQQHMEVISKLRHRHLVSVLGHYIVTYQNHHPNTASTVFSVLEHVANGSLRDHLTDLADWIKREYLK